MIIYLLGFPGSGKTTHGKKLANKISFDFVDLDDLIEKSEEMEISTIFADKGEDYFREIENKILKSLSERKNTIIATGGGTPCYFDNMHYLNDSGLTIYIKQGIGCLVNRLRFSKTINPLVEKMNNFELSEFVQEKLDEREVCYLKSHYIVNGKGMRLAELVKIYDEEKSFF
jgi:shikimate kinase